MAEDSEAVWTMTEAIIGAGIEVHRALGPSVTALLPIHEAQLLTYLQLSEIDLGLLMNFNTRVLPTGLRRLARKGSTVGHSRPYDRFNHPTGGSEPE